MRILIAVDSSPFANDLLDELARRRWPAQTELCLLTIVEPAGGPEPDREYFHQVKIILQDRVNRLIERLPGQLKITGELIVGGAAPSILKEATRWKADLLIIGSHGDTGARRESIGSVAAAIVNDAPCSLEVVKLHTKKAQTA